MKSSSETKQAQQSRKKAAWIAGGVAAVLIVAAIMFATSSDSAGESTRYYEAKRGNFLISIVEGGSLEAQKETSIRNEVEGTARIIWIIPEGTYVKEGDLLVELDSGSAQDQVNQQEITVQKSALAVTQAEKQLEIGKSQAQSDIRAAEIKLQLAEIDLEKFKEGELEQQRRTLELEIDTYEEQLEIDKERYQYTTNLFTQGFETKAKVDQDRLTLLRTEKSWEQATNALWMFETFDKTKMLTEYASTVEEAQQDLKRVEAQALAQIAQLEADLLTQKSTHELNIEKLERDKKNLNATKIHAPTSGLVVYPFSENRFSQESMIEEGATVRYRQEILKLPDTSQMKLTIKVHESHVSKVKPGQPAYVVLDPAPDQRFQGQVSKVALLPANQDRFSNPNLKVYNTEVIITDPIPPEIKPGVSARAEVVITNLQDVITVPIQAVTTLKGKPVVYLAEANPTPVPVEVGLFNTQFIEIKSGIQVGDRVLLSPPLDSEGADLDGGIMDEGDEVPTNNVTIAQSSPAPGTAPQGGPGEFGGRSGNAEGGPAADGEGRGFGPPGGAESGGGGFGGGNFNREEMEARRAEMMKQFDKDGDGEISDEERTAMMESFRQMRQGAGGGGFGGGPGGRQRGGGDNGNQQQ